jgi:glutamyl-tRNA synthetase
VKPGYVEQAMADLRWLGLECDGEPLFQSGRSALYTAALEKLRAAGLAYPCVCSRREVESAARAPHEGDEGPVYPGTCRGRFRDAEDVRRHTGLAASWRFAVDALGTQVEFEDALHGRCAFDVARQIGDFVVFRGDGIAAYQLATVVDDHALGVTEVVRGDDLIVSTPRQLLLYRALGLTPPRFLHVPLVLDAAGQRMAKRRDSTRLAALREAGVPASRVIGALAASCGWAKPGEPVMPDALAARFSLSCLPRQPVWIVL